MGFIVQKRLLRLPLSAATASRKGSAEEGIRCRSRHVSARASRSMLRNWRLCFCCAGTCFLMGPEAQPVGQTLCAQKLLQNTWALLFQGILASESAYKCHMKGCFALRDAHCFILSESKPCLAQLWDAQGWVPPPWAGLRYSVCRSLSLLVGGESFLSFHTQLSLGPRVNADSYILLCPQALVSPARHLPSGMDPSSCLLLWPHCSVLWGEVGRLRRLLFVLIRVQW